MKEGQSEQDISNQLTCEGMHIDLNPFFIVRNFQFMFVL